MDAIVEARKADNIAEFVQFQDTAHYFVRFLPDLVFGTDTSTPN